MVIPTQILASTIITEQIEANQVIQQTEHRSKYVVVPITINVVEGTSISKETIKNNIKKMNEIYNCEVVIFVWDGRINTVPDPSKPGGKADGKVLDREQRDTVRNDAEKNAHGRGVSITIASDLGTNINGYTIVGGAHSALVRNDTDGTTWAHEVQHALGQSHGSEKQANVDMNGDGKVDSSDTGWDVNRDGRIDNNDKKYNLWGRRSDRTGNEMTPAQHNAIFGNASALPGARIKNRPAPSTLGKGKNTTKTGVVNDTRKDPVNRTSGQPSPLSKWVDIIRGAIVVNYTLKILTFWMQLAAAPIINCTYDFVIDNNESQSDNIHDLTWGADIIIEFSTMTFYQMYQVFLLVWDENMKDWVKYPGELFSTFDFNETINFNNYTGSGWVESYCDVIILADVYDPGVPGLNLINDLEGNPFDMWLLARQWDSQLVEPVVFDNTSKEEILLQNKPVETITVNNDTVKAGSLLEVKGVNFTPNSKVTIYIDGTNITTVQTDSNGSFSVNVTVPSNLGKENAILMARDESGKADAIYIDIQGVAIASSNVLLIAIISVAIIAAIVIVIVLLRKRQ